MTTAPSGWITALFTDVFDIQGGTQPPKSTFRYSPAPNLVRLLQIRDFGDRPVPTYILNQPSLKLCRKDDILIGRYGASVGRICTGMDGAYNVALAKVIIPGGMDQRFVFWLLKSPVFQQPILRVERSAQNGFNKNDLSVIPVPLPPFVEQRRVVEKLEDVIGHVNSARDHLSRVPAILKRFRQAVLAAACSGRLTEDWRGILTSPENSDGVDSDGWSDGPLPVGWSLTMVGEIGSVKGGKRLPKRVPYASCPTDHPYIRVTDFRNMSVASEDLRYIDEPTHRAIKRYTISDSDLYISIAGTIGKVGLVPPQLSGANLTENAAKITDLRNVRKKYLAYALNSKTAQNQIEEYITSSGQPKLALFRIEKLVFPLPSLEEQDEVVLRIENLLGLAEVIEKRLNTATLFTDKLTQSILAKAFRGELVPTEAELALREGREYEHASVFLGRIKKEREEQSSSKPKQRRRRSKAELAAVKG